MNETHNPWTILSEKSVYDNPWISLAEYKVLNPSGNEGIYGKVHFGLNHFRWLLIGSLILRHRLIVILSQERLRLDGGAEVETMEEVKDNPASLRGCNGTGVEMPTYQVVSGDVLAKLSSPPRLTSPKTRLISPRATPTGLSERPGTPPPPSGLPPPVPPAFPGLPKKPPTPLNTHSPKPLPPALVRNESEVRATAGISPDTGKGRSAIVKRTKRKPVYRTREEEAAAYGRTFATIPRLASQRQIRRQP